MDRTQAADISIERAHPGDLAGLVEILNHYIRNDHCTFDTQPWTVEQKREWFGAFNAEGPYRLLVAKASDKVLGYASSTRWRPKKAYEVTVETTVYVHPEHLGAGLGTSLLGKLLDLLSGSDAHSAVAGVAQPNPASNRLHDQLGYEVVGTFREVGFKFDRYWDVTWYQKIL